MKTLCNNYSIIKNAILENFSSVFLHKSNKTQRFLDVLYKEGLIRGYNLYSQENKIEVYLKYYKGSAVIQNIKAISSPGRYIYFSFDDICYWDKNSQHSFLVLSTSKNVISSKEAKRLKVGGKVLCVVS
jgi:small subunit ribosomal protein S8